MGSLNSWTRLRSTKGCQEGPDRSRSPGRFMAAANRLVSNKAGWRELLQSRNFAWLWTGQLISQLGDGLSKIALLWFVYNLTGSALKMTIIGILQTVPPLVFGPFAGVYVDRLPKRAAMIGIDFGRVILLALIPILYAMQALTMTRLYILVFLNALISMAFNPALNATIPLIAKRQQLTAANALMQTGVTVGQLLGPGISGVLIVLIGAHNVLYVNAATFLISALCKFPVRLRHDVAITAGSVSSRDLMTDFRAGVRFIFVDHRMTVVLMAIAALFSLGATGFVYLLPVFGERMLHATSVELGWLWSSLSLGILIATLWLAWQKQITLNHQLWLITAASFFGGMAILALTVINSLIGAALLIMAIGGSAGLVTPIVSAALQAITPKELLARVFSFFNTGAMGFAMIGMVAVGWAADKRGAPAALMGIACLNIATAIGTAVLIVSCRRLITESRP